MIADQLRKKFCGSLVLQRIVHGASWSFAGTLVSKLIILVAGIACAQILGKEAYGEFGMVRSTINMFVAFGSAGIGLTATKYIAEHKERDISRVSHVYHFSQIFALIVASLLVATTLSFSEKIAIGLLDAPQLTEAINIGALLLFVTVLNAVQSGALSGFECFKIIAINSFWGSVAEAIFMLLGAYFYGVYGAVLGFGVGFIALYVLNTYSLRKIFRAFNVPISWKVQLAHFDVSILARFTLPATLSAILIMPAYWVAKSMLVKEGGFAELALFEAADQWRLMILFVPTAVSQVILPTLAGLRDKQAEDFWQILRVNILINVGIASLCGVAVAGASSFIMSLYGQSFDDPWPLVLLALSAIPIAFANVVGLSISSRSKMWEGFAFNLVWAVLFLVSSLWFLSLELGAVGIALAVLSSYSLHAGYQLLYLVHINRKSNYSR